jgi:hypothetical protein
LIKAGNRELRAVLLEAAFHGITVGQPFRLYQRTALKPPKVSWTLPGPLNRNLLTPKGLS